VWLLVQIGDVFFPMVGLPDWTLRMVLLVGILGLPLIVYLAWTFQITPGGIRIDTGDSDEDESNTDVVPRKKVVITAVNLACLLLGITLTSILLAEYTLATNETNYRLISNEALTTNENLVLAVDFHPSSYQPGSIEFIRGVEEELRHCLIQLPYITVVPKLPSSDSFTRHTRLLLLSGSVYFDAGQVHALVHLLDVKNQAYLWTTAFEVSVDSLLDAEKVTAQRVATRFQQNLMAANTQVIE
jgi:TolB-like protein